MDPQFGPYIQILLLLSYIVPAVFFMLTQQRILEMIHPLNRRLPPPLVWIQLIPIVGLVWQFWVISNISDSIRNELNTPASDSIFAEAISPGYRPTFHVGILYAALFCISIVAIQPLVKGTAALAAIVTWIIYWVQLYRYKNQLKERRKG